MQRELAYYVDAYWAAVELTDLVGIHSSRSPRPNVTHGFTTHDGVTFPPNAIRVLCLWAVGAKGEAAAPFASLLLASSDSERRGDATDVFIGMGASETVVPALLGQLAAESEVETRDAILVTLGHLRARPALPALAAIIRDDGADGDTRELAIDAVGRIARKRFAGTDPRRESVRWLEKQGL